MIGGTLDNGLGVDLDDDDAIVVIVPPAAVCDGIAGGFRLFGGVGGADRRFFFAPKSPASLAFAVSVMDGI